MLIRCSVALRDSDTVRDVVLVVLGLSHFSVSGETSDQVDPGEIPGGRCGRESLRTERRRMSIDIREESPIGVEKIGDNAYSCLDHGCGSGASVGRSREERHRRIDITE